MVDVTAPAIEDEVRIRMYRVGFGDSFLVSFPGNKHVLVDCGVHNRGNIGTFDRVLDNIESETGRDLAIVVASHAHEDHISGFGKYADRFRQFRVREVWLPWSEDRTDPLARRLRERRSAAFATLESHLTRRGVTREILDILENASAARNEPALANLRNGLGTGAAVAFLRAGDTRGKAGGIAGLTASILGPPRDEAFLRRMDPPKAERYMRATGEEGFVAAGDLHPFENPPRPPARGRGPRLSRRQRTELRSTVKASPDSLAFALDRAINNTSVVVVFRYRGRALLFAGDSQYGGWLSWLSGPAAAEILADVDFYKVAHHGSENATPKSALEVLGGSRLSAMVSTQSKPWPSIPYTRLMDALVRRTGGAIARSDSIKVTGAPAASGSPPGGFETGPFWIDYRMPV